MLQAKHGDQHPQVPALAINISMLLMVFMMMSPSLTAWLLHSLAAYLVDPVDSTYMFKLMSFTTVGSYTRPFLVWCSTQTRNILDFTSFLVVPNLLFHATFHLHNATYKLIGILIIC